MIYRPNYSPHQARLLFELAQQPNLTVEEYERQRATILAGEGDIEPVEIVKDDNTYKPSKLKKRQSILAFLTRQPDATTAQVAAHINTHPRYTLMAYLHPLEAGGDIESHKQNVTGTGGYTFAWRLADD